MVTAVRTDCGPGTLERAAVRVLAQLLPGPFRQRQRDEWLADLGDIPDSAARRRYLLGAAWTLPALWSQVRRAGDSLAGTVITGPPSTGLVATVFLAGVGWPVLSWLLYVPLQYFAFDIPDRIQNGGGPFDPKDLWPSDGVFMLLVPLQIALYIGAHAAVSGPWLLALMALSGLAASIVRRGYRPAHRVTLAVGGVMVFAWVIFTDAATRLLVSENITGDPQHLGLTTAIAGGLGALLAATSRRLGPLRRVALVLIAVGALAVYLVHRTSLGFSFYTWLID